MRTRLVATTAVAGGLALALGGGCGSGGYGEEDEGDPAYLTGNGAPSGDHFTLNIIGGPGGDQVEDPEDDDGATLFVPSSGRATIVLSVGDFAVLDDDATDGWGALRLPAPDRDDDAITSYSVFARPLGKPGGSSTTQSCARDGTETFCSVSSYLAVREKGMSRFQNVTRDLLVLFVDRDDDGELERFDPGDVEDDIEDEDEDPESYFWQVDNQGAKLVQLRFYAVPTTVE
jgi:hypothetical protein